MSSGKWRPFCLGLNVLTDANAATIKHTLLFVDDKWTKILLQQTLMLSIPTRISNGMTRGGAGAGTSLMHLYTEGGPV